MNKKTTLIKNGLVINPDTGMEYQNDVLIEGSLIKIIGNLNSLSAENIHETVDASGKWVVPGLIDLHVHLREPGEEWKETIMSGAQSAVSGGFTSICAMPNTNPVNDCEEITRYILQKAKEANFAKVYPIGAVSRGLKGKEMAPFSELFQAGCVAFSDDGYPVYDPMLMRRALEWCLMHGAVIACHEEERGLTVGSSMNESPLCHTMGLIGFPKVAEEVMIARDIELARITGGRIHICHVTTSRGVELIRRAKEDGIAVTAEVTPHHLTLTEEEVYNYNTAAKVNPPLRNPDDVAALVDGLAKGIIDAVASDHAPHDNDTKRVEFDKASYGLIGLQTTLPLLLKLYHENRISRLRLIESVTNSPAKIFSLNNGKISPDSDADITIIDPDYEWKLGRDTINSKSYNTPFLNQNFKGIADTVFVNGNIVVSNKKLYCN